MLKTPFRIRDLQRKLYRKAKQSSDYKFYTLYDKVYRVDILTYAYKRIRLRGGTSGIDGASFEDIEAYGAERYIQELSLELKENRYRPSPVKRVYIPKSNGDKRPLGIPTIKDRIVQMATKIVIEPIFETDFEDNSYGFRPKRNAHQAMDEIAKNLIYGHTTVIDADLSKYFDTISHTKLLSLVAKRVVDKNILRLIKQWLKAPIVESMENGKVKYNKNHKYGTPQGGVISPLLANIYLNVLDKFWKTERMFEKYGARIVRYADDFVILCRNPYNHNQILERVKAVLEDLELRLHPQKTVVVDTKQGSFDFLGFSVTTKVSDKTGKRFPLIRPSAKAEANLREKVKNLTKRNMTVIPTEEIVKQVNTVARGWKNYFYYGGCSKSMSKMGQFLTQRMRVFLRRKHKIRTLGFKQFPNSFLYDKIGLYKMPTNAPWTQKVNACERR
ncbi:group II intron reverse transcriptase/maturase [Sulfurovum sp. bin170]|uniref:group II intron reverse transcriptase/maturase n=1 Tax=Sulfurovum sp. bin170 TaxID=2695268 RepID=UPI0013DEE9B5|nr:group II intron reverse transcriptase/maturase [Sulfurovum sp. bin170]NEW60115.1 group II intron reverse transcriptase/maturase [Sulfurovum sp. bin170]